MKHAHHKENKRVKKNHHRTHMTQLERIRLYAGMTIGY